MSLSSPSGFFTGVAPNRYRLPHRRLGLPVILLIHRVLERAFEELRSKGLCLAEAEEDDVTAWLRSVIESDLRMNGQVEGFNKRTYEPVIRQGQVANYDGTRRAKSPDLCFKLRYDDAEPCESLSEFDALFVECKPVDKTHPAGSKYCNDGLIRFVNGDYAWAMQDGMMLGYSRDGRSIADHLIPAMAKADRVTSLATKNMPQPLRHGRGKAGAPSERIHKSIHRREFHWPDNKGKACDITIYHVWFDCS